jgi:hypothetical protein
MGCEIGKGENGKGTSCTRAISNVSSVRLLAAEVGSSCAFPQELKPTYFSVSYGTLRRASLAQGRLETEAVPFPNAQHPAPHPQNVKRIPPPHA